MAQRKTIEVAKVLTMANTYLAAKDTTPAGREAVASLLEGILFETNNYMGFRYLPDNHSETDYANDGTRRYYYPSATVQASMEDLHE